jgi:uncharacterized protein (DUF4415 family)
MAKKEHFVGYSVEMIDDMLARGESQTDLAKLDAKTEADIAAGSVGDPAWNGIYEDRHKEARAVVAYLIRLEADKRLASICYDADVVDFFKSQGRGWQARMNAVPRGFMQRHHS